MLMQLGCRGGGGGEAEAEASGGMMWWRRAGRGEGAEERGEGRAGAGGENRDCVFCGFG